MIAVARLLLPRLLLSGVMMATLGACATDGPARPSGTPVALGANPSAVIAAELAFARAAQEQGQWSAFAMAAAPEAQIFVPQRVNANQWLKGRANPSVAVKWQPNQAWSSCDGSYAATHGNWEHPGSSGSYTTIWQRQPDGQYKWLLDMSLTTERMTEPAEMVQALVADCAKAENEATAAPYDIPYDANATDSLSGQSTDGSLMWQALLQEDGARQITIWMRRKGTMEEVLFDELNPAANPMN